MNIQIFASWISKHATYPKIQVIVIPRLTPTLPNTILVATKKPC